MNTVGMCALLGVMATQPATPENRAMTLTLVVPEDDTLELEAFLHQRAGETWQPVDSGEPARFVVAVERPTEIQLVVSVREAGRELARREIDVADPGATKLTVWLVVKSTINRALLEGVPEEPVSTPLATEKTRPAMKEIPRPTWGLGAQINVSTSFESFNVGPALVAWLNPWERLVITLEAGYRISPEIHVAGQGAELTVHHVPLTLSAGWQLNPARTWTAGGFATADLKIPVANEGSGMAVGLDLGGYVQTRLPLTDHSRFFARMFAGARTTRMRFLLDEGSITEGPVVAGLGLGVLWQ